MSGEASRNSFKLDNITRISMLLNKKHINLAETIAIITTGTIPPGISNSIKVQIRIKK